MQNDYAGFALDLVRWSLYDSSELPLPPGVSSDVYRGFRRAPSPRGRNPIGDCLLSGQLDVLAQREARLLVLLRRWRGRRRCGFLISCSSHV